MALTPSTMLALGTPALAPLELTGLETRVGVGAAMGAQRQPVNGFVAALRALDGLFGRHGPTTPGPGRWPC